MSPSSSAASMPSHVRARRSSNATPVPDASVKPSRTSPRPSGISSRPGSPAEPTAGPTPHYTVFIRLPFARGDFQDPAPTNWTTAKDRQLWKLISKSHSGDLDWAGLSQEFDVELNFLLMQAAWLSERHIERMRRQVTRIGGAGGGEGSGAGSSVGGVKVERTGSRESKLQSGSTATAVRRGSPSYSITNEGPGSSTTDQPRSGLPPISRTPSSTTVTQSKLTGSRIQQPRSRTLRGSSGSTRKLLPAATAESMACTKDEYYEDAVEHEGHSDSNSESEDEPPSVVARSQAFRRPPPTSSKKTKPTLADFASEGDDEDAGDDDDESSNGGYLPFAAASTNPGDPASTLRKNERPVPAPSTTAASRAKGKDRDLPTHTNTTASSQSSASSNPQQSGTSRRRASDSLTRPAHPLSPRYRAQLASLSPQSKASGSPSMGSSFSDLDDASVTQSALEEALLSNMRAQGGSTMASRMSNLRDALGRGSGRGKNLQGW